MRAALVVVLALGLVSRISAECANACSGHGVCRNSDQCDCFPNYAAADCSQRVCPYGLAWVDNPNGDLDHNGARSTTSAQSVTIYTFTNGDSATPSTTTPVSVTQWENFNPAAQSQEGHYYAECSNKGLCDRSSGLCVCFDGYTGSSCQRTTCPNDCSGNGVCRTVFEVAAGNLNNSVAAGSADFATKWGGLNRRQVDSRAGKNFYEGVYTATDYRLWDGDMAQTCVCDPGFSGPDCSQRECPRGDDPLTHRFSECPRTNSADSRYSLNPSSTPTGPCLNEVQTIQISAAAATTGADWFHLLYKDWTGKIWSTDDFLIGTNGFTACTDDGTLPIAADHDAVASAIEDALEAIPNGILGDVTVTAIDVAATYRGANRVGSDTVGYLIQVTFTSNPGNVHALSVVNSADDQVNLPTCKTGDRTPTFTTSAVITEYDGNKELSTCSNRGVCDTTSGLCKCFKGYYGGDCSMQNALSQ